MGYSSDGKEGGSDGKENSKDTSYLEGFLLLEEDQTNFEVFVFSGACYGSKDRGKSSC
ncbi:MAG: hypothetical protein K0S07_1390 [Chlamydiales bacterium]|jgi:hypothetical protein|nr:hypothetical protein [Chlamydiales bacterium]